MIDLHCHVHYGVDDGPKTVEDTIALLKAYAAAGVETVACTSHLRRDKNWVNDASVQEALFQRLEEARGQVGRSVQCLQGAEHYFDEQLFETCKNNQAVTYGDTKWLLLELPYQYAPPNWMEVLYSIRRLGYRILLAHIERFPYVVQQKEVVQRLVDAGYILQVNLGSLAGAYHKEHKKHAEWLVAEGYASILGGDCHQAEDVGSLLDKGREVARKLLGDQGLYQLCEENPRLILNNSSPEELP